MPPALEADIAARTIAEEEVERILAQTQQPLRVQEIIAQMAEPVHAKEVLIQLKRRGLVERIVSLDESTIRRAILRLAASGRASVDANFKLSLADAT
jgi:hypothetical protein